MALPDLESLTAGLDRVVADTLGDTVRYAADGMIFLPLRAHVDYRDASRVFDNAQLFEQAVMVNVLKADVPMKPGSAARITFAKVPGATFKPINVRTDESGTHWEFDVQKVGNA